MKINILASIRTGKTFKYISAFVAISILTQCISPTVAFALTSGPGQQEFASFEPATTTDMVDLYSGDFNYNIPLLSVPGPNGGYPINLAYHSGIGMEQEASWVGLGWNINVGAINRQLRGLPDDYNGDPVEQKMHLKENTTVMLDYTPAAKRKFYGIPRPSAEDSPAYISFQMYYNTYKGLGARVLPGVSGSTKNGVGSIGLGVSYDSQEGLGIEPSMSISAQYDKAGLGFTAGASYNSRSGLQGFSFSSSIKTGLGHNELFNGTDCEDHVRHVDDMGYKTTSSLSFSTSHSVPTLSVPMRTEVYPFDTKYGLPVPLWQTGYFKYQAPLAWTGAVSHSQVANDGNITTSAYGYLYTGETQDAGAMKDFQRAPISYSKKVPYLAPSSFTYDLYTQTGQGAGSMFRPYYSSTGVLATPQVVSKEFQTRINLEGGFGFDQVVPPPPGVIIDMHACVGTTYTSGSSTSGKWSEANNLEASLGFTTSKSGDVTYEPFYFKQYGEKSGVLLEDDQLEKKWGGDQAVRTKLAKIGSLFDPEFQNTGLFIRNQPEAANVLFGAGDGQKYRKQRQARSSNIEMLTDDQALVYGGKEAQFGYTGLAPNKTFNHGTKISEISVLQSDGMRYTYGLPAYNNLQIDALFSVNGSNVSANGNNIPVPVSGNEINPATGVGTDEYLSQTTMNTPYAHSWLLTSVVSADYIDLTGDGPSPDDYGYWVKFNYQKTATNYKWRTPYSGAHYMEGNRGEPSDDKASFSYGEKEIYFLTSVETKTHIAFFEPGERFDCIQANGKHATKVDEANPANNPMKALRSIKLYGKDPATGRYYTPIKTVNFGYSYTLCQGTENSTFERESNRAKLTLDRVSFTYQNSDRGELSAYKFKYGNADYTHPTSDNPMYDLNNMDRWGNYKNNGGQGSYPYKEFPYTNQSAPPDVAKWSLTQIELPTGGTIKINYESDDYGYVETKKATHMFDIMGIGDVPTTISHRTDSPVKKEPTEKHTGADQGNFRVYFKLDKDIRGLSDEDKQAYVEGHIQDIEKIYFKIYAELTPAKYDYVTGYANVAGVGPTYIGWTLIEEGNSEEMVGYVTLKSENLKKHAIAAKKVNPFTKAAIQHLQISRPELVYNASGSTDPSAKNQILNLIGSVGTFFNDIMAMARGFNTWAYARSYGQRIELSGRSIIRLNDPDGIKYGGGVRVAKVAISDNWDATTQEINSAGSGVREYGQKYDYRIEQDGQLISSGVAYEPTVGGDESALKTPVEYEESTLLGTTHNVYLDNPVLQEYYPGASVGYRKVTVSSLAPDQADLSDNNQLDGSLKIERTAAPITIYEFYTPKDFPVVMDETDMSADPAIVRPILIPGIYSSFKKKMARSQGYMAILNDMAGKMKAVTQRTRPSGLNKEGALISKEEYIYNTDAAYSESRKNRLSNRVPVLTINTANNAYEPVYQTGVIGQSHDVFIDAQENSQKSEGYGVDINLTLKVSYPPPAIVPVIVPLPYASESELSMRTVVTMKVIQRTGILKKVVSTSGESVVTKESMAFDLETGKPLLTKTTNEFRDPIYHFAYPAHWYYQNMGGAYKNYGITVTAFSPNLMTTDGYLHIDPSVSVKNCFNVGDELLVNNSLRAHVNEVDAATNYIQLIKREGGYVSGTISSLKVINSGRKNLLDAEVGKLLSKELIGFNDATQTTPTVYSFNKIVDASAVEYSDKWRTMCSNCGIPVLNTPKDLYATGERGMWRPYISYAYKTDRLYAANNSKEDGIYADFNQFPWHQPMQKSNKWIATNTIREYSPHGFELENTNAIGIPSSALYGYRQSVPVAVAKNAEFKELLFDSFEDYRNGDCLDHHYTPYIDKMTPDEKHTGRYSIRLKPGEKVEVESILKDCSQN